MIFNKDLIMLTHSLTLTYSPKILEVKVILDIYE